MKIYSVHEQEFCQYGQVIASPYYEKLKKNADRIATPETGSAYRVSEPTFEETQILEYYSQLFGGMDVQIGYCWGRNDRLNALEWHKSSEIAVALSDMVMIFGDLRQMSENTFHTSNLKAFLLKEGESIEIYATTMHFCPCMPKREIFKNVVVLPRGTNTPLQKTTNDKKLISKNKWLIVHRDFKKQVELGRVVGLTGENIIVE